MASSGRGSSAAAAAMRKKRRTIGGFRGHAMGDMSFDNTNNDISSSNFSLSMVPEDQLSCLGMGTGSDHIVVAVRVRPLSEAEKAEGKRSCCDVMNGNTVVIKKGADPGAYLRSQKGSINEYTFDAAFPPEAGQSEVYEGTAKPYISELLQGMNVTVFAYGATGAGKTHTMMGSERVVGTRIEGGPERVSGIVPQSLVELFRLIDERIEDGCGEQEEGEGVETWTVRVGYLQVYNEQIYDLLTPSSKPLKINEDPSKGVVVVAGLAEMEVGSSEEVLDLLRQGNANRRTEATSANQVSSRSHAVLQVMVTRKIMNGKRTESLRESKLSLIDLAGSERASATNNRGEQLRQGANINKSLLSLANCINALAGNRRRRGGKGASNVKYRDSKLTHLLKASLEGHCRLVMIANVNPSHVYFDDSHNTLKYANRAKNIKVDPRLSESVRSGTAVMDREAHLAKEYEALKERNALVESQLEAMRHARGFIAPEPAGFTDLFAPNTSSIMSVASSTPGGCDRYGSGNGTVSHNASSKPVAQPLPNARARGGVRTRSSIEQPTGVENGDGLDENCGGMAMPPPAPRGVDVGSGVLHGWSADGGLNGRGEAVDSEDATTVTCADSPEDRRMVTGGAAEGSTSSTTKRKRGCDDDAHDEDVGSRRQHSAGLSEAERERAYTDLAAERTRVRELEGKVRELESSMARMGEQHDITMELVETWRNHKETADAAVEEERATVNELLSLLKDKEREVTQLRTELAKVTRPKLIADEGSNTSSLLLSKTARRENARGVSDHEDRTVDGIGSTNKSSSRDSRSGMMLVDEESAFLYPAGNGSASLEQIEEKGLGQAEDSHGHDDNNAMEAGVPLQVFQAGAVVSNERRASGVGSTAGNSSGSSCSKGRQREARESPPVVTCGSSASEVASAIKSQRKSSMIPRTRKSMIRAPRSSATKPASQRRLGDVTNRMSLSMNNELHGVANNTPAKKATSKLKATNSTAKAGIALSANLNSNAILADDNNNEISISSSSSSKAAGTRTSIGSSRRTSAVRGTPRAQQTKSQRLSIAGRTRSRLSMAAPVSTSAHVRDMR